MDTQHTDLTLQKLMEITNQNITDVPDFSEATPSQIIEFCEPLRITDIGEIEKPNPIISIGGNPIATPGNLMVVSGASKASKTSLCNVFIAGAIRLDDVLFDGFPEIEIAKDSKHLAVIHIDTEQSKYHHALNFRNAIVKRSGRPSMPDYLYSYNIRQLPINQYQDIARLIFKACAELHGGIHLAVIDGVADFIASVNDEADSNGIVHFFSQLAIEYNTLIVLVIHLNPGSDKERGHLGSQLQRKAETILAVRKDGDLSYIDSKDSRIVNRDSIPAIQFKYDKEKHYHVYAGVRITDKNLNSMDRYKQITEQVFDGSFIGYSEAISKIANLTNKSIPTAKRMIKDLTELELIVKGKSGYKKRTDL